jgi:outer membrane lipoprotein-sorting protein
MEIINNDDTYEYLVEASFLKDDYYKVRLVNQTNNHEQIILKNADGVYVVTPSLNKSFKFQSEWPSNSSQSYLLASLLNDVKNDSDSTLEENDNNYIIKAKVNYPNNSDLSYEKIYFDKSMNIEKVEVYNTDDILKIKVDIKSLDLKAGLDEDDFNLDDLIDNENSCEDDSSCSEETSSLDDIIYPLYIPSETYLTSKDIIDNESDNRVILTYSGSKNFVLVEEKATKTDDFEIIPVYGDPFLLNDSIAALQANSITWTSNNIEYYLAGNDLSSEELVSIATSLANADIIATNSEIEK